ncbi:MAG: tripartite tricarboxylate transporter substrate binding protein [Betaproteobacteria bacterium]|nr:tripartite tricarboxylate transporter substrate binding protein [Betaproteobacteria bacterium]
MPTRRLMNGWLTAMFAGVFMQILTLVWSANAHAQSYPAKPIKLIAPYPPGGGLDTVSRAFAERLAPRLGQPVTVENRPGGGATIGGDVLAKSAPDGYTLMVGSIVDYSLAPHFHRHLTFDMRRDFVAIVEIAFGTVGLVVAPSLGVNSVAELIALAKAKPGQLSFASSGNGGAIHLNGEMFKQMAAIDILHVPYKGTTQFQPDLMAGRVQFSVDNVLAHLPHVKSGKVRVLAVASRQRSPLLPDVPTMSEAGVTGFESSTNYTLFAPAGMAAEIVAVLNKEANAVLQQPELRERLLALGIVVTGGTTETVQAKIPVEMVRWAGVIKAANIRPE